VAIVSARAGTTRDVVEVDLDLGGYPVVVADTAGLREVSDEVEEEGVRRARARAGQADLKLVVLDALDWPAVPPEVTALVDRDALVAVNKVDLRRPAEPRAVSGRPVHTLSVKTGEGVEGLLAALEREVAARCQVGETPALTRVRHRQALEECQAALGRFSRAPTPELGAEDLRLAARALGRITGRVAVEDILNAIFRQFCIGK
jgi:tRNA modification GTPase